MPERRQHLRLKPLTLVIPHQANLRIIESAATHLGIPFERVMTNVEHYGNTSAASIPIALCEAVARQRLHPGDRLVIVGMGGGLTWGAAVIQWSASPVAVNGHLANPLGQPALVRP